MEKGMSTEIAQHDREDRRQVDTAVRPGDGPVPRPPAEPRIGKRGRDGRRPDAAAWSTLAATGPTTGLEGAFAMPLPRPLRADPVERGAAKVPTLVTTKPGHDQADARSLAQTEQPRGTPLVNRRTE